jgi:hypothetical protein
MEANVDPSIPGSRLEADHPEIGVLFARLFTVGFGQLALKCGIIIVLDQVFASESL